MLAVLRSETRKVVERALAAGWVGLVCCSTLLLGGVHANVLIGLAGAALLLIAGLCWLRVLPHEPVAWALAGLAGCCVLQLLPLPPALHVGLAPSSATAWDDAQSLLGTTSWTPISLEPEATRQEALKYLLLAAVWLGAVWFRARYGLQRVAAVVFTLGLVVLLIGWAHQLSGAERVYGWYEPKYAGLQRLGPLLNPNNLAGLMNLSVFAGLACALHPSTRSRSAWLWLVGVAVLSAASLHTGSRGGVASLILGWSALALWLWWRRESSTPPLGVRPIAVWGSLLLVVGFVLLGPRDTLTQELKDDSLRKLDSWRWSVDMLLAHPWTGTGRGAFGAEAGRFRSAGPEQIFVHAENWVLEWFTGFGFVVGGLAVVGFVYLLRPARLWGEVSGPRVNAAAALGIGLWVVAVHNLVDLGFEVPGVALPFLFLLAGIGTPRRGASAAATSASLPRIAGGVGCAVLAAGTGWLLADPPRLAHDERRELTALLHGGTPATDASFTEPLRAAILRHPGDAYLLRLGALSAFERRAPDTLRWLNASLLRDPQVGRTHLLLAHTLQRAGRRDQALLALRTAAESSPELNHEIASALSRWGGPDVTAAVPDGASGGRLLLELALRTSEPAQKIELLERARERAESVPEPHLEAAAVRLDALTRGVPPCDTDRDACLSAARSDLDAAARIPETQPERRAALEARWLWADQGGEAAFRYLREHCPRNPKAHACANTMLEIGTTLTTAHATEAAEHYLDVVCTTEQRCLTAREHLASIHRARGEWWLALEQQRRVAESSNRTANWLAAVSLAEQLGLAREAQQLLARAARAAEHEDPVAREAVAKAKQRLSQLTHDTVPKP